MRERLYTRDRNGINMEYPRVKRGRRVSHFLQGISAFRRVCRARPCEPQHVSQTRPFLMLMARVVSSIARKHAPFSLDIYIYIYIQASDFFSSFFFFFLFFVQGKRCTDKRKERRRERVSSSIALIKFRDGNA